jgi:hypothetical protein
MPPKYLDVKKPRSTATARALREDVVRLSGKEPIAVPDVRLLIDTILTLRSERLWGQLEALVLNPEVPYVNRAACAAAFMHGRRQPGTLRSRADAECFFDLAFAGLMMEGDPRKIGTVVWDALRGLPAAHQDLVVDPLERWRVPALMDPWWVYGETIAESGDPELVVRLLERIERTADVERWLYSDVQRGGIYLDAIDRWRTGTDSVHPALAQAEVVRWTDPEGVQQLTVIVPIVGSPTEHGICATWGCRADFNVTEGKMSWRFRLPEDVAGVRARHEKAKAESLVPAFIGRSACEYQGEGVLAPRVIGGLRMLAPPSAHFRETPIRLPYDLRAEPVRLYTDEPLSALQMAVGLCTGVSTWFSGGLYRVGHAFLRVKGGVRLHRYDRFLLEDWLRERKPGAPLLVTAASWQEDLNRAAEWADEAIASEELGGVVRVLMCLCLLANSARCFAVRDGEPEGFVPISVIPVPLLSRLATRTLMVAWTSPAMERMPENREFLAPIFAEINGASAERCEEVFSDAKKAENVFMAAGHVLFPEWKELRGVDTSKKLARWDRPEG